MCLQNKSEAKVSLVWGGEEGGGACMLTCRCKVAEAVQDVDQDVLWRRQFLHPGNQGRHRTPPAPLFYTLCS